MVGEIGNEFEGFAFYQLEFRDNGVEHILGKKGEDWHFLFYRDGSSPRWIKSHFYRTAMSYNELDLLKHADKFEKIDAIDLLVEFL